MASFALYLVFAGSCVAEPPMIRPHPTPSLPDTLTLESVLESSRRFCIYLRSEIAWEEKLLSDLKGMSTARIDGLILKMLAENREELEKHERWVSELERYLAERNGNPGSETARKAKARLDKVWQELWFPPEIAPPPREKK